MDQSIMLQIKDLSGALALGKQNKADSKTLREMAKSLRSHIKSILDPLMDQFGFLYKASGDWEYGYYMCSYQELKYYNPSAFAEIEVTFKYESGDDELHLRYVTVETWRFLANPANPFELKYIPISDISSENFSLWINTILSSMPEARRRLEALGSKDHVMLSGKIYKLVEVPDSEVGEELRAVASVMTGHVEMKRAQENIMKPW